VGALCRDFDLDNFSGLDYNEKTDLAFLLMKLVLPLYKATDAVAREVVSSFRMDAV